MRNFPIITLFLLLSSHYLPAQNPGDMTIEPYEFENREQDKVMAEMGTLTVPANRRKDDGKTLTLKFVRFKSTNPNPGAPIVYLAGGPGGSGIATARGSRYELFMAMREVADVIAFDQRGTGLSSRPPAYPEYWTFPFDRPHDKAAVSAIVQEYTTKAADFWEQQGVDLSAYNTNESADDLNDLRLALGVDKISLWSISYGSHLALATMKRHGEHLARVILAGVEGLDDTVKLPSDTQKLLERIDSLLKADPVTRQAYPDFLGDLRRLLKKVEESPVSVKTIHPFTKEELVVKVGKYDLQILLALSLRGPATFSKLPYQCRQMLEGDFSSLSNWVLHTHGGNVSAMSLAMDVASGISRERLRRIRREQKETLFAGAINYPYFAHRAALPHLDLGEEFRKPVSSDLPVLCISGTLDGRTQPGNAEKVLRHLPNGHHLLIRGAGHSDPLFLSSPKIKEIMLQFMRKENLEEHLEINLPPVQFYLPSGE